MTDQDSDIAALKVEMRHVTKAINRLECKVDDLTAQANKGRGAFFAVIGLGGVFISAITWVASRWPK
jgi:hypothetical protein